MVWVQAHQEVHSDPNIRAGLWLKALKIRHQLHIKVIQVFAKYQVALLSLFPKSYQSQVEEISIPVMEFKGPKGMKELELETVNLRLRESNRKIKKAIKGLASVLGSHEQMSASNECPYDIKTNRP